MTPTEDLIRELERTRDESLKYFSLSDADLARAYAPGKWSVRHLLNHLTDSEIVLSERLRRAISEPGTVIWFTIRTRGPRGSTIRRVRSRRVSRCSRRCAAR